MKFETTILRNLLHEENYLRQVIPFLKDEYFVDQNECRVLQAIRAFVEEYNAVPTTEALTITLERSRDMTESAWATTKEILSELDLPIEPPNLQWLVDSTEKFVKDKALFLAIQQSVFIMQGKDPDRTPDALPTILQEALGICFDNSVGHNYLGDAEARYEFYTKVDEKLKFDIDWFNKITNGGVPRKTLNIVTGGVGVGKTMVLCHLASAYLNQGYNVLYITLEMAEEEISRRIDANLLNMNINDLAMVQKTNFINRINVIREKTEGKLFVKEYPSGGAHVGHFRALINELALKQQMKPDVIIVDYIGICASSRLKRGDNTNTYVKSIAEELRGLAQENNAVCWSGAQFTRSGIANSDPEMGDTAYAIGLVETADLDLALITSPELEALGQYLVKQLKNRYNSKQNKKFVVGVDLSKMKLYNVDWEAQKGIVDEPEEKPFTLASGRFDRNTGEIFDEINTE